ncbi:MAG: ATP-dependent DNA helicase RecG [Planctomycetes bacterium]|nr:ATP-dependent DNA helicase RecG [Planctomycetota bacterium]
MNPNEFSSPPSTPVSTPDSRESNRLETPIRFLKGVGPKRATLLERIGIKTVEDLFYHLPRTYQDLTEICPITKLTETDLQLVCGTVDKVRFRRLRGRRSMVEVLVSDESDSLLAVWFNQPYMQDKFSPEDKVLLSGKPTHDKGQWKMTNPQIQELVEQENSPRSAHPILPVYPLTEGLTTPAMHRAVKYALQTYSHDFREILPTSFLESNHLVSIPEAFHTVHFPLTMSDADASRYRIVFEEFLLIQLALLLRRGSTKQFRTAPQLKNSPKIDTRIRRLFEFEFTDSQNKVIQDICADLAAGYPMNRLLQGDVGSGKTAVAVYALLLSVAHQYQAVLMAPTEILALQHWNTLQNYLLNSRVRPLLLTGSLSSSQRQDALRRIQAGDIDLVIGTQAVIQKDVIFHRLGLVVIDEQHKFGVQQRASFRTAGNDPHYLVMSATPIPRTLCMTLFGDLDISTIDHSPPGRKKVKTFLIESTKEQSCWEFVRRKIQEGRQAYVVCPLIGSSNGPSINPPVTEETSDQGSNVLDMYHQLQQNDLSDMSIGLLHGRMDDHEKTNTMKDFRSGAIQVLVCTTVIEVGVDIPNASIMLIHNACSFGLSQLHQLRGRVGRGSHTGHCFLFPGTDNTESIERLEVLTHTGDGFAIAEADFEMRGSGDILGTRQHGVANLRAGNLLRDQKILLHARKCAQNLLENDPSLKTPAFQHLRQAVLKRYGHVMQLADLG